MTSIVRISVKFWLVGGFLLTYLFRMRSVEDIEAEIEKLPAAEVRRLAEWLTEYQARLWDSQIVEDAQPSGRLRQLIDEAKADFKNGRTRPLR